MAWVASGSFDDGNCHGQNHEVGVDPNNQTVGVFQDLVVLKDEIGTTLYYK